MFRSSLILLSVTVALSACQADPAPPPSTPTTQASAPAASATLPGTDASAVVAQAPADPQDFDRKALAGRYAGALPDGRPQVLEIEADGIARLDGQAGSWSISDDATRLLFDPDDKAGADRWFAIQSTQELRALDAADASPDAAPALQRD